MRHNCKELQKFRQASDIDISIKKAINDRWALFLFVNEEQKEGSTMGMGIKIGYCPFCGEKLEEREQNPFSTGHNE